MTVHREAPGLWTDDAWSPGTPGTFAIVMGVSAYRHLGGGTQPVERTYGLSQLAVSALTAHRFFDWLRNDYHFDSAPLARCWLRLAPTEAEQAAGPIDPQDYAAADYAGMRTAVGEWFSTLEDLTPEVARASRAFLFFSGHGLEVQQNWQVLLPSDYLCPPLGQVNDALSTSNLMFAMRRLQAREQFVFVDACRNGAAAMGTTVLQGNRILNEAGTEANVSQGPRMLYATSSGSAAWQQPEPSQGLSLFGQALLDGLRGRVRADDPPPAVWFQDLGSFTNRRVQELLRAANSPEDQPVIPAGPDARICEVTVSRGAVPPEAGPTVDDVMNAPRGNVQIRSGWSMHACTGSERIEEIWRTNARLVDLETGEELGPERLTPVGGERLDVVRHWFHVAPQLRAPALLTIWDGRTQHAALLPGIPAARFELALHWNWAEQEPSGAFLPRLATLDVDLAPSGVPALDRGDGLWRRYRRADAGAAADEVTDEDLAAAEHLVRSKMASPEAPLGAVVAAVVLLRAGRLDRLHDWLGNITRWFPDLPDGPALWAEQLGRQGPNAPPGAVFAALLDLARRAHLPFTQDAFGYALSLSDLVVRTTPEEHPEWTRLAALRDRLVRVAPLTRPGGLFLTLAGSRADLGPEVLRL